MSASHPKRTLYEKPLRAGSPHPLVVRGNSIVAGQRRQLDQIINQPIPSLTLEPLHGTW